MHPIPGLCDRCGQRFALCDLREEFVMGKPTGLYTCSACYDEDHPQLDTRNVRTNDKQSVDNPRSDAHEREASRSLWAWNPVGQPATSTVTIEVGRVRVQT